MTVMPVFTTVDIGILHTDRIVVGNLERTCCKVQWNLSILVLSVEISTVLKQRLN